MFHPIDIKNLQFLQFYILFYSKMEINIFFEFPSVVFYFWEIRFNIIAIMHCLVKTIV